MKQIKYCKCGHQRNEHEAKHILSLPECKKCQCSKYMSRKLPNFISIFFFYWGLGMISLFTVLIIIFYNLQMELIGTRSIITLTREEYYESVIQPMIGLMIIGIVWAFLVMRFYIIEKHRKSYPVEPNE